MKRADYWRGYLMLVRDVVDAGSRSIESVQKELAGRVFKAVQIVPGLESPVKVVQTTLEVAVTTVHSAIRGTSKAVVTTVIAWIDLSDPPSKSK